MIRKVPGRFEPIEEELPNGEVRSLFRLTKYLKPYKWMLLGVLISLIITSASVLTISRAIKFFIDSGLAHNDPHMLDEALIFLIALIVLLAAATFARFFLITFAGEKVVRDIRMDMYKKMLSLSPSFYEKHKAGAILSRLAADSTLLLTVIGGGLSIAMRNALLLIGGVIALLATSPKLTAMLAIIIPLIVAPIIYLGKELKAHSKRGQDRMARLTAHAEETIHSIRTIQAYAREQYEMKIHQFKLADMLDAALGRIKMRGSLTSVVIVLVFGGVGFVLWIGGYEVLHGEITAGALSAFIYVSIVCAGAVGALTDVVGDLHRASGATERLFEFLATEPDIKDKPDAMILPENPKGHVKFENVVFYYPTRPKKPTLDDVTLDLPPGKVTAVVGRSGMGKSTVFQLLERFYDIQHGSITFDGIDIRDLKLKSLREQFTFVSQEPVIFSATAYENILYGRPDATVKEVREAAEAAAALTFIEKLPEGFDTYLGEKGIRISGGQRQRIAIARAMLHNPKILLLDEATSALDAENEQLVQKALKNLMKGRTTIVIAHRISTVKNADQIVVLEKGQIAEIGTHKTLMNKKNSVYAKLAKLQLEG